MISNPHGEERLRASPDDASHRRANHEARMWPILRDAAQEHGSSESDSKRDQCSEAAASRLVRSLMWATSIQAASVAADTSKSLARRRHLPHQAKVRSTTQRRGTSWKPLTPCGRWTISIVHGSQ